MAAINGVFKEQLDKLKRYPRLDGKVYIYALHDPVTGEAHYIGQAIYPFTRIRQHLLGMSGVVGAPTKKGWLAKLWFEQKSIPDVRIAAVCSTAIADICETALIEIYLRQGKTLYNKVHQVNSNRLPARIRSEELKSYNFQIIDIRRAKHLTAKSYRHLCDGCHLWCKQLSGDGTRQICSRCEMKEFRHANRRRF
jgi:hypothetical protein